MRRSRDPVAAIVRTLRTARHLPYEWWLVATLSVTETISWGIIYYGFPVFLQSMERTFAASRVGVTGALSIALAVSAAAALPVGRWLDRYGPRALMTAGSCLAAVLVFAWSRVDSLGGLYVVWGLMGLVMAAVLYEPAFATVVQWFPHHRERALLTVTLVAGFASTIFMPCEAWLLGRLGWRGAAELLAVILAVTTIPLHVLVLRAPPARSSARRPDDPPSSQRTPFARALTRPVFWALALAFAVGIFSTVTVSVHMIPYLTQHGRTPIDAAAAVGWIGAMQIPGRLLFVPVAAWFGTSAVTVAIFFAQGVAMAAMPLALSPAGVIPEIVLLGGTNGMATLVRATIVAELFGRESYGSISGAIAVWANGARALGPVGASLLEAWFGTYERVFWTLAGSLWIAGVMVLIAVYAYADVP